MLAELRVTNYAVIDELAVEFGRGLNLLTGETGAGKSLLVDALALLLGEKASAEVIRHGCEKAVLTAVFAPVGARAAAMLDQLGLGPGEANGDGAGTDSDRQLIIRREIIANGKGRVFINHQPATVAALKQLAPELAAVHAQHESLRGLDAAARLELLDQFSASDTGAVAEAHTAWKALRDSIAELERSEQDRLRMADLWSFQKKEIEAAKPETSEDERLEAERRILANAEKIYAAAMGAYDALYESAGSALERVRAASRQVEEMVRLTEDEHFRETGAQLDAARIAIDDVSAVLRDFAGGVQASPERLAEVEDRLAALERLKRKYGPALADVIAFGEDVTRKLNEVEHRDDVLRELRVELATAAEKYLTAARALSRERKASAQKMEKRVEAEINELAMKARFRAEVLSSEDEPNWSADGFDAVQFAIATNPGEPLKPLEQIASGGELSRVTLALKVVVEKGDCRRSPGEAPVAPPALGKRARNLTARTLVFDEIDIGIGGRAADAVGRKLKELAAADQVLCVTHLPQIAAFADHHFRISKREAAGKTKIAIQELTRDDRKGELARMLSGAKVTDASLKNAEQMLKANA
jgi:DNA repair protein RecN (Recombination protein N)